MTVRSKTILLAASFGAATLVAGSALGAACPDLPNAIYGSGGSAVTSTLGRVAVALRSLPEPITVFWHDPGACPGFKYVVESQGGLLATDSTGTSVKYWDANGTQQTCDAVNVPLDFSHMGNTADYCTEFPNGTPANFGDFLAPVQTLNFITDKDSSQKSISAEALYYIFGLGAEAADIAPWTNPGHLVFRQRGSFVHQLGADAIFGELTKVYYDHPSVSGRLGVEVQTNGQSVSSVASAGNGNPESPLGYVSGNAADTATAQVKTLAFRYFGQECAYWPSSSEAAKDKINVRQGLYALWTPGHFYAPTNSSGAIISNRAGADATERAAIAERVQKFIGWFTGSLPAPTVTPPILERIIAAGDIPLCAMQVTRDGTFGAVSSYAPDEPCGCYYEAIATGNSAVCDACSTDDDCTGTQKCRFNYCEAY